MTRCDLCVLFEEGSSLNYFKDRFGDLSLKELFVCEECKEWLDKILSIRSRYVNMIKEIKDY